VLLALCDGRAHETFDEKVQFFSEFYIPLGFGDLQYSMWPMSVAFVFEVRVGYVMMGLRSRHTLK
jgi:hypothetical protein